MFVEVYTKNGDELMKMDIEENYKDNLINILKYKDLYKAKPLILQPESNKPDMVKKALDLQKELLIKFSIEARLIPQCHKFLNLR